MFIGENFISTSKLFHQHFVTNLASSMLDRDAKYVKHHQTIWHSFLSNNGASMLMAGRQPRAALKQTSRLRWLTPPINDNFLTHRVFTASDGTVNIDGLDMETIERRANIWMVVEANNGLTFQAAQAPGHFFVFRNYSALVNWYQAVHSEGHDEDA
jgi:hypothetical protein